jgi:EmrB/QacA subfamily drug resistance transporter
MIGPTVAPCDTGVIRRGAAPSPCSDRAKPWVLAATIVGSSMAFIDATVVNVALPALQGDLAMDVREAQWVTNAYLLMLGALILTGGAAGDLFGRRRVFIAGVVLFTAASVACGLARSPAALILARGIQGIGAALLTPSSLAIISAAFPEQERGRAIGLWAGASALTIALGPVLGGFLVDSWSWRAIFFINVPIAAIAIAIALRHMPESRDELATGIDWPGSALTSLGLGALTYGLSAASTAGWLHLSVLGPALAGTVMLALFLWWEARARAPMMPLALFRSRTFSGANAITLLLYFALGGVLFFVPFNLIRVQGYSATAAGAAFLPFSLLTGLLSRWSGSLADRYGPRRPLIIGPAVAALGFALLAVPDIGQSYWTSFFPAMVVVGLGMAISVAPLTTTVMRSAADRYAGIASGINNATARVAGLLAVALLGSLAVGAFGAKLDARLLQLQVPTEVRQALQKEVPKLAEAQPPRQLDTASRQAVQRILDESFVHSFRVVMLIAAALALLSAACAWLTIEPRLAGKLHATSEGTSAPARRPPASPVPRA